MPITPTMAITGRSLHRLLLLARSERGMALPTALFAMIASFALASAAVLSSVDAQQGTKRDRSAKSAIAAADAGASVALLRLNRFQSSLTKAHPCVGPGGEEQQEAPPGSGWCEATPAESVGVSTFSYAVSAYQGTESPLSVVSVGTAGGVSRRVEVGLISYNTENVFADEQLIGQSDVTLEGNPTLETDLGTNGGIAQKGESAEICGNIRVGPGQEHPEPECGGEVTEGEKNLPAIVMPENLETENDDCLLDLTCKERGIDTYTTSNEKEKKRTSTNPWDAVAKTINVGENASLTMGGTDYLVCGIYLHGGNLIMAATAQVRIFVDTPEHCGLEAGTVQVEATGNANIESTGFEAGESYNVPVIYVLGSPTISTGVKLCGNSGTNELVLYAPYSDVEMCGSATWEGMIAGKTLRMNGSPTIKANPKLPQPSLSVQTLWERTRYVECTGAGASPPDSSC